MRIELTKRHKKGIQSYLVLSLPDSWNLSILLISKYINEKQLIRNSLKIPGLKSTSNSSHCYLTSFGTDTLINGYDTKTESTLYSEVSDLKILLASCSTRELFCEVCFIFMKEQENKVHPIWFELSVDIHGTHILLIKLKTYL